MQGAPNRIALLPASLQRPWLALDHVEMHLHPQLDLLWSPEQIGGWLQSLRQKLFKCSRA